MKLQKSMSLLIAIVAFPLLACGLGDVLGGAEESIRVTVEAVAEDVADAAQEAATSAASEQEAAESDQAAAEQPAEPAAESAPAEPETAAQADETTAGDDTGGTDLPVGNIQDSLANLDSYQAEYRFAIDAGGQMTNVTLLMEETRDPRAMHVIMQSEEGTAGQLGGLGEIELYVISGENDSATMYMQNPQDQSWMTITAGSMDEAFNMLPMSPGAFSTLPEQSQLVGQDVVNGVPVNHYTYNQEDFLGAVPGLETVQGEIWIDEERNLVMKMNQRVEGSTPALLPDQAEQTGSYTVNFEIKKVNDASIVITPPETAGGGTEIEIPGVSPESGQLDLPMPEDAQVEMTTGGMVIYSSSQSVPEVWQFYKDALGSDNWNVTIDTSESVMAQFNDGATSVDLMIAAEGGETRVILNSQ